MTHGSVRKHGSDGHGQYHFHAADWHSDNTGANYRTRVFWHSTQGRAVKNADVTTASSTTASSRQKLSVYASFLPSPSQLALMTSSVSQRPEPRAGIKKHRVRSVYYQPHILYAMRRHKHPDKEAQVTQPPEGYFWATEEEEMEENKSVIDRRPGTE